MNLISRVPKQLGDLIDGYRVQENSIGHSNCTVFHLTNPSKRGLYLKVQSINHGDLLPEKERLEWLQGKLPVPVLIYFDSDNENQFMLISEIRGVPSFDLSLKADMSNLMKQLATGLKEIHSLPQMIGHNDSKSNCELSPIKNAVFFRLFYELHQEVFINTVTSNLQNAILKV
ncbi:hypothetical protein NZD89_14255 [Alicyclobacillus fastidiosus]|uniref:Aminoglycoside phosphotransferase domain-containing protein n=1 Tax=Alicyclobacillus fastidiosus TaxID=392011 RepID=A0ABY6ZNN4_9BACL|nr:phosphotransferase [Alicyclobacillus fastidiosus]WAH44446.1 hypothetical protein NZD89_14255 [Alicyclobacillus fastidiosus]GMA60790.1 hypothetical protein GCM10025859_12300 [Alicyclobacillus fastidiosus]